MEFDAGAEPETLDETYECTLREINLANWELTHRLFQFVAVAVRPLRVEELAELLTFDFDTLGAKCGLRRDRIKYSDPSSETVCSRGCKIVKDYNLLAHYTDNGRENTHHQTKRRMKLMRNRQSLHYPPQVLTNCGRLLLQQFNINSTTNVQ